ncbi:restriction endonuclease [Flavobacterium sp.]|uniref:restriction endonuclease n=1 Tax=Flavobacterium sp. TaxID=239 RepID=UPI002B4B2274|nr:restriction endonuclease [Flavobacterium sp.]HLP64026.1 restriction endonuclease [Flavobacterium sp.]
MKVVKHSGIVVDFDASKLRKSLLKSGANQDVVEAIMQHINNVIYDGIPTKQIYKIAFGLLKKESNSFAAQYNLRDAILLLGPAGFYFEKFIARIFESEGFTTQTNLTLNGKCVSHEIDVVLKKDNQISMVECKFHSSNEVRTDVKVPMYILSRFNDLKDKNHIIYSKKDQISNCWIVTNSRFTLDAITFAHCSGLNLLSWDYPKNNNLRTKIDQKGLYPTTCLTTLTRSEKDRLLTLNCLLVVDLIKNPEFLEQIGLSSIRMKNVIKEATSLCNYFKS